MIIMNNSVLMITRRRLILVVAFQTKCSFSFRALLRHYKDIDINCPSVCIHSVM